MATGPIEQARRFHPGWALTLCTALAAVSLFALGTWQLQRLQWKTALIEDVEAGLAKPARRLSGEFTVDDIKPFERLEVELAFDPTIRFFLGTEARGAILGTTLLMGARDRAQRLWLTELGWIPDESLGAPTAKPTATPMSEPEMGLATVVARPPRRANFATPEADVETGRVFAEDRLMANGFEPLVLVVESGGPRFDPPGAAPAPPKVRPDLRNNHLGYAITWYGLCAALIGVYIAFGRSRAKVT